MTGTKLRSRFKNSEVGPIPSSWNVENLASLVDPDRGIRYGIVQPGKFDPNGRFLIRGQDYSRGWVDSSEFFRVSDAVERRYRNARVATGDLIITIVGASTGEVAKVPAWLNGANLTQTTARVAIDTKRAHPDFIFHMLRSQVGATNVASYVKGGAQPGLNCGDVERFRLPVPESRSEQQAIAEALSDADALIEGLERLIAKKRLIKQGAMQELLTSKRRLPGFSGEWETRRLAEVGQVKTGLTYSPRNVKNFGTLVLRSSNIQEDRLVFTDNVFVDVDVSDEATVRTGDLLICVRNGSRQLIGKTAIIDARADGMAFGAFMSAFRSDLNDYLIWCFQSSIVQRQVAEHLGATINQITNKTLKGIEIPLPLEDAEREAIAAVLTDMDTEIQALETRLEKARQVKEGMMQNLLTGRIRLV